MYQARDKSSDIFNAVRGLVFFGTPFRGAVGMSVSPMVQAAAQEYEKEDIETKPLEVLEQGNELLQTLLDDFQAWVWPKMLQTQMACFYELQASEIGGIVGRQRRKTIVVNEYSASLDLSERVSKYPLERTHFNMNKFAGKDEFDYQIVAKVVQGIAAQAQQPSAAVPLPPGSGTPKGLWHMPFAQSDLKDFVGREETFRTLESKLFHPKKHSRTALLGLGGVGKSRLAMEVAYRMRASRPACSIFWVQATDSLSFERDYLAIGTLMGIPGLEQNGADVKSLVCRYLSQDSAPKWLLILDNADDPGFWAETESSATDASSSLTEHLPRSPTGSILVTTRSRRVASHLAGENVVELKAMSIDDAEQMLKNRLEKPDILSNHEMTQDLLRTLTYLPLAIVQAAAYLNKNDESIKRYLWLLKKDEDNAIGLLSKDFNADDRHKTSVKPVATTFLVSFRQIQQHYPMAAEYLSFASCLSEKNIPQSLFPPAQIEEEMFDAFGVLRGYGFFTRHDNNDVDDLVGPLYDMHRLVRLATRNWLRKEDALTTWTVTVFRRMVAAFPAVNWETRNIWMLYLPHAQVLCDSEQCQDLRERFELLFNMSICLNWSGKDNDGAGLLKIVHQWAEPTLGDDDGFKVEVCRTLGVHLIMLGRYIEAEDYVGRALKMSRKALGREHAQTISCMMFMGTIYVRQGRWQKAESVLQEGIGIGKKVLGPEHPDMLLARAELAHVYAETGRLGEAETMQLELLELREKCQGHEHPDTLIAMSKLSTIYRMQGRPEKAEKLSLEACKVSERILGPEHPLTFYALTELSVVYYDQHRWKEAEEIAWKCFGRSKVLGREAWQTLVSMELLALIWKEQDRLEEAIAQMRECVEASARTLGLGDRRTKRRSSILDMLQQQLAAQAGDARPLSTIESSSRVAEEEVDEAREEPGNPQGGTESSSRQQQQHGPQARQTQQQQKSSRRKQLFSRLVSRKKDKPTEPGP